MMMPATPAQVMCPSCSAVLQTPFAAKVNDKMTCGGCQALITVPGSNAQVYPSIHAVKYEPFETSGDTNTPSVDGADTLWPKKEWGDNGVFAYDGICGCLTDVDSCVKTLFCPCYVIGRNAQYGGDNHAPRNTALVAGGAWLVLTAVQPGIGSVVPGIMRNSIRAKVTGKPEGKKPLTDLAMHCLCPIFATCQEARLIKRHQVLQSMTPPLAQSMDEN